MSVQSILTDLIALRTDNYTISNKPLVDYICRILSEQGIIFERLFNPDNIKENIIAGINVAALENINEGIVLSGHMDTVEANENEWQSNPFEGAVYNSALYGRGSVDMKYFIAEILDSLPFLKASGKPIFLLFSSDEETEVNGIKVLLDFFNERKIYPQYALVGEPTDFKLCVANKGYAGYTTTIKGVSAHSSSPELGINAGYVAARLILEIEKLNSIYKPLGTTLNVGVVNGGQWRNTVLSELKMDWEVRYIQSAHREEILSKIALLEEELAAQYGRVSFVTEEMEVLLPFECSQKSKITAVAHDILQTGLLSLPYATEAGFLQKNNIDVLICGAGDEKLAHTNSEHIKLADLERYKAFLLELVKRL